MRRGKACSGFSKTIQAGPWATRRKSVAGRPSGIARYTSASPTCSMRRNSKPVAFPPVVSRCMASMRPPEGAIHSSSLSVPLSSPDHAPASQVSAATPGEPGPTEGQSGAAVRSRRESRVIDRLRGTRGDSSCPEARGSVLDGSDTEQLTQPARIDERPCERSERLEQRPRGKTGDPPELPAEVGLVDVRELGAAGGPAGLRDAC